MRLGILDWGIGGCGLYQLIKQKHPEASIIYLSDAGYTPYGKVEEGELKNRVKTCIDFLKDKGATHIAIACNAAGSVIEESDKITTVVHHAKQKIIESKANKIGVIGGKRIVDSKLYELDHRVHSAIAQPLSALIEAGFTSGDKVNAEVDRILSLLPKDIEELLMACTHYPAVNHVFRAKLQPKCKIIDPSKRMHAWIEENWQNFDYFHSADEWYTTGNTEISEASAKNAFNVTNARFEKVSI